MILKWFKKNKAIDDAKKTLNELEFQYYSQANKVRDCLDNLKQLEIFSGTDDKIKEEYKKFMNNKKSYLGSINEIEKTDVKDGKMYISYKGYVLKEGISEEAYLAELNKLNEIVEKAKDLASKYNLYCDI